jgi:predicted 3-demethylubiquinone-9 3-methyltransferase (glyoxalase superfamily)
MATITPRLWFDGSVGEAAEFHTTLFPNPSFAMTKIDIAGLLAARDSLAGEAN